jgi:hypothetical protein
MDNKENTTQNKTSQIPPLSQPRDRLTSGAFFIRAERTPGAVAVSEAYEARPGRGLGDSSRLGASSINASLPYSSPRVVERGLFGYLIALPVA